jgi:hypothetical protein
MNIVCEYQLGLRKVDSWLGARLSQNLFEHLSLSEKIELILT